jgi:hypothetical protein
MADDGPSSSTSTIEDTEDDDSSDPSLQIITVIDAPLEMRGFFTDISNLTALRRLDDVDIRKIQIPPNTKRINPGNRLIELDGWQEIYQGKTVWIYDAKSNVDQCVRLVSPHSDFYGTAT